MKSLAIARLFLFPKLELRVAVVNLSWMQKCIGCWPVLVGRIGEFLRFDTDGAALLVAYTSFADNSAVEEVSGIDLHAGLGGVNF